MKRFKTYEQVLSIIEILNINPTNGETISLTSQGVDGNLYEIEIYFSIYSLKWSYRVIEA